MRTFIKSLIGRKVVRSMPQMPFADNSRGISSTVRRSRFLQVFGQSHFFRHQSVFCVWMKDTGIDSHPSRVLSRQDSRTGCRTKMCRRIPIVEFHAVPADAINIGCFGRRGTKGGNIVVAQIISQQNDNIRWLIGSSRCGGRCRMYRPWHNEQKLQKQQQRQR